MTGPTDCRTLRGTGTGTGTGAAAAALLACLCALAPVQAQEPDPIPAGVAPPPGVYAPGVDVVHYEVEVGLGYGVLWFEGITHLTVAVTGDGPDLPLDFTGLGINRVTVDGVDAVWRHEEGILHVPLDRYEAGDTTTVMVHYEGTPDDGLIIRENVHGEPSAFVDNWPNRTRFWLPGVDHPADKATVRFTIHAPAQWRVIANGALASGPTPTPTTALGPAGDRSTWVWEVGVPISPYNMVIGAADLEVRTVGLAACGLSPASRRTDGCVEVTYWVYPQDVERAAPSFLRAAEMIDHFASVIGPYPFEKLANVQSATRFGGMENASAIFYSEQGIASGRNMEGTVSHEIAHQWFGDAVTEADWHHLWLSEGFATYFGAQFFEAADGADDFRERMEQSRLRVVQSDDVARPIYDPSEQDLFALLNDNNYPKGGWVLHMLRGVIGDDAFFRGIREYYGRYMYSVALTEDFERVMEEVSGRELTWFFRQWIYEPGFPVLAVESEWLPDPAGTGGSSRITIRQLQSESWPAFRIPMEIDVVTAGRTVRVPVELQSRVTTLLVEALSGPPTGIILDPDGWVLKDVR